MGERLGIPSHTKDAVISVGLKSFQPQRAQIWLSGIPHPPDKRRDAPRYQGRGNYL